MDTLQSLFRKFEGVPKNLDEAMRNAIQVAGNEAAHEAQQHHLYKDRSGALTKSTHAGRPQYSLSAGTPLYIDVIADAPHALFIERGTKRHAIKAKNGRALKIPMGGGFLFRKSVQHPGTKPYRFLQNAVDKTIPLLTKQLIPAAIEIAFDRAGFTDAA